MDAKNQQPAVYAVADKSKNKKKKDKKKKVIILCTYIFFICVFNWTCN